MYASRRYPQQSALSPSSDHHKTLDNLMKETVFRVIHRDPAWSWSLPPTVSSDPRRALRYQSSASLRTLRFSGYTWGRHFITTSVLSRLETDELHIASVCAPSFIHRSDADAELQTLVELLCSDDVVGEIMKVVGLAARDLASFRAADSFWELLGLSIDEYRSQLSRVDGWIDGIFSVKVRALLHDYPYYQERLAQGPIRAHVANSAAPQPERSSNNKRPLESYEQSKREVRPRLQEPDRPQTPCTTSVSMSTTTIVSQPSSPTTSPEQSRTQLPAAASSPVYQPDYDYPRWTPLKVESPERPRAASVSNANI